MRKLYSPKRTLLARYYIKDHKRRLARFNYSIKQEAKQNQLPENVFVIARRFGYAIHYLDEYLGGNNE